MPKKRKLIVVVVIENMHIKFDLIEKMLRGQTFR